MITVSWEGTILDNILTISAKVEHGVQEGVASIKVTKVESDMGEDITSKVIAIVNPNKIINTPAKSPITPEAAVINVRGVPQNTQGLVVRVALNPSVAKFGPIILSNVPNSFILTDSNSHAIGIVSTVGGLPQNFTLTVPFEGENNGTTLFSTVGVFDMVGGSLINGATASTSVNKISVKFPSSNPPPVDDSSEIAGNIMLENDTFKITLKGQALNEISAFNLTFGFDDEDVAKLASGFTFEANGATELLSDIDLETKTVTIAWTGYITDGTATVTCMLKPGTIASKSSINVVKIEAPGGYDLTSIISAEITPNEVKSSIPPITAYTVSPSEATLKITGVPAGTRGLVVETWLNSKVTKFGGVYSNNVKYALIVADSSAKGIGIISTAMDLPSGFSIVAPFVGVSNGTSVFSVGRVLDMLGGKIIEGASVTSNIEIVEVGQAEEAPPPEEINDLPTCLNNELICKTGLPTCVAGKIPTCGSVFGFTGEQGDSGCTDESFSFFESGAAFCSTKVKTFSPIIKTCNKTNLCPANRARFKSCREDKASCSCICQFKITSQKFTPRCTREDEPVCSKGLTPLCTEGNSPACYNGKLVCEDDEIGFIDLTDLVFCE